MNNEKILREARSIITDFLSEVEELPGMDGRALIDQATRFIADTEKESGREFCEWVRIKPHHFIIHGQECSSQGNNPEGGTCDCGKPIRLSTPKESGGERMVQDLRNCRDVQGTDGNWNHDDYMRGVFNGLELALSIFEQREPIYKEPFSTTKESGGECPTCKSDSRHLVGRLCWEEPDSWHAKNPTMTHKRLSTNTDTGEKCPDGSDHEMVPHPSGYRASECMRCGYSTLTGHLPKEQDDTVGIYTHSQQDIISQKSSINCEKNTPEGTDDEASRIIDALIQAAEADGADGHMWRRATAAACKWQASKGEK